MGVLGVVRMMGDADGPPAAAGAAAAPAAGAAVARNKPPELNTNAAANRKRILSRAIRSSSSRRPIAPAPNGSVRMDLSFPGHTSARCVYGRNPVRVKGLADGAQPGLAVCGAWGQAEVSGPVPGTRRGRGHAVVTARRPHPRDAPPRAGPLRAAIPPADRVRPGRRHNHRAVGPAGRKCSGSSLPRSKEIVKLAQCCGRGLASSRMLGSAADRDEQTHPATTAK